MVPVVTVEVRSFLEELEIVLDFCRAGVEINQAEVMVVRNTDILEKQEHSGVRIYPGRTYFTIVEPQIDECNVVRNCRF